MRRKGGEPVRLIIQTGIINGLRDRDYLTTNCWFGSNSKVITGIKGPKEPTPVGIADVLSADLRRVPLRSAQMSDRIGLVPRTPWGKEQHQPISVTAPSSLRRRGGRGVVTALAGAGLPLRYVLIPFLLWSGYKDMRAFGVIEQARQLAVIIDAGNLC
jgi:hypothetical protein